MFWEPGGVQSTFQWWRRDRNSLSLGVGQMITPLLKRHETSKVIRIIIAWFFKVTFFSQGLRSLRSLLLCTSILLLLLLLVSLLCCFI